MLGRSRRRCAVKPPGPDRVMSSPSTNATPASAPLIREANALREAGRLAEAEAAYLRILERWPALPDCWFNLGVVQRRAGQYEAALASYREALTRGISGPEEVHLNRAVIYSDCLHQSEAAEGELRTALGLNPSYVPALLNLANLHEDRGEREPARSLYGQVLALDPLCFAAFARLVNLMPRGVHEDQLLSRVGAAIARPEASAADRAQLGFALGRALDGRGEYREAFVAYEAANRASRASVGPAIARYDRSAQEKVTDELISSVLPTPLARPQGDASAPRPIFICGMFRSRST